MKRDMDLVRDILLRLETADGDLAPEAVPGHPPEVVARHFQLLVEAGLIQANLFTVFGDAIGGHAERLTWEGHEYLDVVRNAGVWAQTKKFILDKGGVATLAIVKAVGVQIIKQHLGLPPGN